MKKLIFSISALALTTFMWSCNSPASKEEAPEQTAELTFMTNIHCGGCVNTVQTKMPDTKGVVEVIADLDTKKVRVIYDPEKIGVAEIVTAFADLGYEASVYDPAAPEPEIMPDSSGME